jgi:hypothetical protein
MLAPDGIGSSTTTQPLSDCASTVSVTRATSPRVQRPGVFCSIGVTVRSMAYPELNGAASGSAARLCTMTHGRPAPS